MSNIKNFKVKINGGRIISLNLETRGMSDEAIDKALDRLVLEFSWGEDVENGVHYF